MGDESALFIAQALESDLRCIYSAPAHMHFWFRAWRIVTSLRPSADSIVTTSLGVSVHLQSQACSLQTSRQGFRVWQALIALYALSGAGFPVLTLRESA